LSDSGAKSALILGASSGFGEAAAREFAKAGYDIFGVHLDRRAGLAHVAEIRAEIEAEDVKAVFFNINAASVEKRDQVLDEIADQVEPGSIRVLLHSLAFGVYWTQGLVRRELMGQGGRIYAMTSSGGDRVIPSYGAVSAAKASLESHCRQLALELAPHGITANSIRAGVTDTPALRKIPGAAHMIEEARQQNPYGRLTTTEDVARCIVALAADGTAWMTGNVIRVDGGEDFVGSMPTSG